MEKTSCAACGRLRPKGRMIRRRLNGRDQYCCSLSCEVRWEKANMVGVCG